MIGVWVLGGVAAFGHLVIWVAIYNRLHATSVRRDLKKRLEKCIYAAVLAGGILGLVRWIEFSLSRDSFGFLIGTERFGGLLLTFYVFVCWLAAGMAGELASTRDGEGSAVGLDTTWGGQQS
jgi:hypothetical protein